MISRRHSPLLTNPRKRRPTPQQSPEQLQQLVAPIALYPDSLVAQILAASTFPDQVVEADRWVQAHPDLKGDALGQAVDQQPWDASVKALTAFPDVLGNMDKNLSWTSSLGDAYYNQEQNVMDAVQVMRQRAEQSGNLKIYAAAKRKHARTRISSFSRRVPMWSTSRPMIHGWSTEVRSHRGRDGMPILASGSAARIFPSVWASGSASSEGLDGAGGTGDSIGITMPFFTTTDGTSPGAERFITGTPSIGAARWRRLQPRGAGARPFNGNTRAARGFAEPHGQSGVHSGAFSGIDHGGQTRSFSSRGSASFGGGGHMGGGGGHGGGGHR